MREDNFNLNQLSSPTNEVWFYWVNESGAVTRNYEQWDLWKRMSSAYYLAMRQRSFATKVLQSRRKLILISGI